MSPEEGISFFQQLLHGLLHNLQPLQGLGETQLQSSPLRESSKDTLAAICQLLGPTAFLQQVLQSVTGLRPQSASVDPKQLEVLDNHVSLLALLCRMCCCCSVRVCCRNCRIAVCSGASQVYVALQNMCSLKHQDITVLMHSLMCVQLMLSASLAVFLHDMNLLYFVFSRLPALFSHSNRHQHHGAGNRCSTILHVQQTRIRLPFCSNIKSSLILITATGGLVCHHLSSRGAEQMRRRG